MAFASKSVGSRHKSLSRARTLRRGCQHEPVTESHLRWLWRAYARDELGQMIPPGLEPRAFREAFLNAAATAIHAGCDLEVLLGGPDKIPMGLAGVQFAIVGGRRRAYPHFTWFKEATPRVRVECALRFILDLKATAFVVIETAEPNWRFFEHLCCYGALRRAGTLKHAYGEGEPAAIYQSVGQ